MISISINDNTYEVPAHYTVLQAAESIGITIPTLCYHKDLSPFGGCRLCVVQVRGARLPMTSCNLPVSPALEVRTDSEQVIQYRRAVLRMLLSNFYDAGYKRYNGKFDIDQDSELAKWAHYYNIDISSHMAKKPSEPVDSDPNPFVWVDMNKCIQCTRCVRACGEIQGRFVWSQSYRGYQARIVAGADSTMLASRCESCGACVAYCPTGALDNKLSVNAGRADRLVRTTCNYCAVGCQFDLNVKDDVPGGRILRVTSNSDPATTSFNGMHLCLKGRYGYEFIHHPRRLTEPRVRQYLLDGHPRPTSKTDGSPASRWVEVDWDTALDLTVKGLLKARGESKSGADSTPIGILASGKYTNEENYLLNKLARQVLGTNHIYLCSHIYNASVVEGLLEATGQPAMSSSFDEIATNAASLFVIGSNLTEQHPVFGARIRQAVLRRKLNMIVASPDFINIEEYAALSLRHHPNTEVTLLNGLMYIILEKELENRIDGVIRLPGFDALKSVINRYNPEYVAEVTGLQVESLYQAADILRLNRPTAVIWSVGLSDSKTARGNVCSLSNLQLLLGNLDRLGGGLTPLRSQNNSQGACDMGALPSMLPGYMPLTNPGARHQFEAAWGVSIPPTQGLTAPEILDAACQGQLKALYILGEDIINASPEAVQVRRALETCDFVILQEITPSETTRYADVILPGVSFAEKSGTFTSSERRVQLINPAIEPIGDSRPDWAIITDLARRLLTNPSCKVEPSAYSTWDYANTAQIMQEMIALTHLYNNVSYTRIQEVNPVYWPILDLEPHFIAAEQAALEPMSGPVLRIA
jgi:predicted molibdopterin-dependent oxidoreductase YjgC